METTIEKRKEFLEAYIICGLWASHEDDNGDCLDKNYNSADLSDEARARCEKDCNEFLSQIEVIPEYKNEAWTDESLAGHDFWLTRNGHGVGFWDGDFGELGDTLTEISEKFGMISLVEDAGQIEIM